jgi:hypothetical protein
MVGRVDVWRLPHRVIRRRLFEADDCSLRFGVAGLFAGETFHSFRFVAQRVDGGLQLSGVFVFLLNSLSGLEIVRGS